ncbi:hypothetical protein [Parafrankia discariae]|uniref:hypothetical protein n=1 Tax=Parafrankia discariae TaxID=365528 RepID=UPI000367230A|nr:hypothetical protein [Parafrankia discariae]
MTAPHLESAYRRLLRCYPRSWRQANEDEVLATLLDIADARGRTGPSPVDAADLIVHGLAARFGVTLGLIPAAVRHRIAILALASTATLSMFLLVVAEVLPEPFPDNHGYEPSSTGLTFGPFVTLGVVIYPIPVLAFTAAALGARRVARGLLGITCLAVCAVVPAAAHTAAERPQMYLLMVLGLLAGMAAAGMPPAVRRRDLFTAAAAFVLLLSIATARSALFLHRTYIGASWNWPLTAYRSPGGLLDTVEMVVPATVAVAALVATAASPRRPGWVVTTFVIGGTWSLMPVAHSLRYGRWGREDNVTGATFALAFSLITVAAVIDLFRVAGLRVVWRSDPPSR